MFLFSRQFPKQSLSWVNGWIRGKYSVWSWANCLAEVEAGQKQIGPTLAICTGKFYTDWAWLPCVENTCMIEKITYKRFWHIIVATHAGKNRWEQTRSRCPCTRTRHHRQPMNSSRSTRWRPRNPRCCWRCARFHSSLAGMQGTFLHGQTTIAEALTTACFSLLLMAETSTADFT